MLVLLIMACKSEKNNLFPTYNNGSYEFINFTSENLKEKDSVYISGRIHSLDRNKFPVVSTVQLGCFKTNSTNGEYSIKGRPFNTKSYLTVISLGYLTMETRPFTTKSGDSLIVNFHVAGDERPLINCEGN